MIKLVRVLVAGVLAAIGAFVALGVGCQSSPRAYANRITSRAEIVGGQRSLGDIGDYVLHNNVIRAVVQNVGYSRGFGVFGGSLIDLDLERPAKNLGSIKQNGYDGFSEMFPAFFLEAVEPNGVQVVNDGSDGNPAVVRVTGAGAEFLTETQTIDQVLLNQQVLDFSVDYTLAPGAQYLNVKVTATNPYHCVQSVCQITCKADPDCPPGQGCQQGACGPSTAPAVCGTDADCPSYSFPSDGLPLPVGFIALVGDGQRLFVPGAAGYDARYALQDDIWKRYYQFPAIGGLVSPMWITEGDHVSYGMMPLQRNVYVLQSADQYGVTSGDLPESIFIPLVSGSFMGTFVTTPPLTLAPQKSFSYAVNMIVGNGDASSVYDAYYKARSDIGKPITTGRVGGHVYESKTLTPLPGAWVVLKGDKGYVNSSSVKAAGDWTMQVPPGTYEAIAVAPPRDPVHVKNVVVTAGGETGVNLLVEQLGLIAVTTLDEKGQSIPAKVSVEGTLFGGAGDCRDPRNYLYDLKLGQPWRDAEMGTDNSSCPPGNLEYTGRYLEGMNMSATGQIAVPVRACQAPCSYKVYVSRGPSYDLFVQDGVTINPGQVLKMVAVLHRAIDDSAFVTGDFHVHSINSIDSYMDIPSRVTSYAAEGVDYLASTDHNFVTDLAPTVAQLNLTNFVKTSVGLELTTLELGHFNSWPLQFQPGPITHGSFQWFEVPTADYVDASGGAHPGLFTMLRQSGSHGPSNTVVEVNHARDSILGYFAAFQMDQSGNPVQRTDLIRPRGPAFDPAAFSYAFDAMEVLNGKRLDQRHNAVAPSPVPPPPLGRTYPAWLQGIQPGQVVTNKNGDPEFPGVVDDWFHLLQTGHVATAMGNSDSHNAYAEAGCPRNFIYLGQRPKSALAIDENAVSQAILQHQVVVSNGPLVETCAGSGCGNAGDPWPTSSQTAALVGGYAVAPSGQVNLRVRIQSAPWVDVSDLKIWRSGTLAQEVAVPPSTSTIRLDQVFPMSVSQNTWFVAEVNGSKTMWPAITAYEQPPILVNDAVANIAAQFPGFVTEYYGLQPSLVQEVLPYAITNPIWAGLTPSQSSPLTVGRGPVKMNPPGPLPHRTADLWHIISALHGE